MRDIIYYATRTESTQKIAAEILDEATGFSWVAADEQTHGKGRFDRKWSSAGNGSLYITFIFTPDCKRKFFPMHSFLMGMAVVDVLNEFSVKASLKWPNDIIVQDRKIAGILSESKDNKIIIGLGLNLYLSPQEQELINKPSISFHEVNPEVPGRVKLVNRIIKRFNEWRARLDNPAMIMTSFRERCYRFGEEVEFDDSQKVIRIKINGINEFGFLMGTDENGTVHELNSGEIKFEKN